MEIKITSTHKSESNTPVQNFFVSIAEFYIGINTGTISLRTNTYTVDENDVKYPLDLLADDHLSMCLNQDLLVKTYSEKTNTLNLTGTEYEIQAQLIFAQIFSRIASVNALAPGSITYELIGF